MKTMTAINNIKQNVQLQEWTKQIKAQQESGMTVTAYCAQNGINIKTYYYHLRKVWERCLESEPAIVPVTVPRSNSDIRIEKSGRRYDRIKGLLWERDRFLLLYKWLDNGRFQWPYNETEALLLTPQQTR